MNLLLHNLIFLLAATAEVVSTGVGMVGKRTVTSREVQIQHLLEVAMSEPLIKSDLKIYGLDSRAFAHAAQEVLLEHALALEAQTFNLMQIAAEDLAPTKRRATTILSGQDAWVSLRVEPREFDDGVRRKMQARRFIKFRAESSSLPVTDVEVQRVFDENRAKYGDLPLEKVRDKIKLAVAREQTEKRLHDWYDGLLAKYAVKNLIPEM